VRVLNRLRVIFAVFRKDFIQLVRYPAWIFQLLIWPLIFPLIYILSALAMAGPDKSGITSFQITTGTANYKGYIVIGTMIWMWVNITLWSYGTYLREEQLRGTLEANWLMPINRFDILIGGSISNLLTGVFMTIVSIIEYKVIYGINFTGGILGWIVLFIAMIPGVYGLGMLFASLILWFKQANAAVNVARGLLMILCGITFPVSIMPGWMIVLSKFIPFTFGIQASRQIMVSGQGIKAASSNLLLCLTEGTVLLILGRLAFLRTERLVRNSGSLERF